MTLTHDQFHIGLQFWCGNKRWRCTDVGSRVIVAISLEPHEVRELERVAGDPENVHARGLVTDDPGWLNGPPFAVVEYVFDEYSMDGCSRNPE